VSAVWGWLVAPLVILLIVAVGVGGHVLFRRYVPAVVLSGQNDVVGFTVSIVAVIYAVVLAFVVVVVWEDFGKAQDVVRREISVATSLQADSLVFLGRAHITEDLAAYADAVACEEWSAMQRGKEGSRTAASIGRLVRDVTFVEPRSERERIAYGDALGLAHEQLSLRSERLMRNAAGLDAVMWWSLVLGGAITIAFTYLLGAANFRIQLVATGLLSALIGLMFGLIISLDYPFRGVVRVGPEPWLLFHRALAGQPASCAARRVVPSVRTVS
jgi:hypothetical protein